MYSIISLGIPALKILRLRRVFHRAGYYAEQLRASHMGALPGTEFLQNIEFVQVNEIYSSRNTLYGLRIQANPLMRRLMRVVSGDAILLALDLRRSSTTFGHILGYQMTVWPESPLGEWLWLPGGFAFGILADAASIVECYCSAESSPSDEISMSVLAPDLKWELCEPTLRARVQALSRTHIIASDQDSYGLTLGEWQRDRRSSAF